MLQCLATEKVHSSQLLKQTDKTICGQYSMLLFISRIKEGILSKVTKSAKFIPNEYDSLLPNPVL